MPHLQCDADTDQSPFLHYVHCVYYLHYFGITLPILSHLIYRRRGDREEDYDDVRAIVGERMTHLKELHGEYCISEMIRRPDSCRRFIIGEDSTDGSAVGVMCLNSVIDVDLLNENFELTPYDGLTKPRRDSQLSAAGPDDPDALFPRPSEHSRETNVFALEIFATLHGTRPACSHDFLVAAFDCFPHLEYCAILLPFSHPFSHFLQHFVVLAQTN